MDSCRRWNLFLVLFWLGCGVPSQAPDRHPPSPEEELMQRARAIHERVLTLDTHVDIPFEFATAEVDPGRRGEYQVDLPKMREGGLDAAFFIVYVGQSRRTPSHYREARRRALQKFEAIRRMATQMYPDQIGLAVSPEEVEKIHASGRLLACIGIENGFVIGKDLHLLEEYFRLGARYMTLAHSGHNDIADSSTPRRELGDAEAEHGGLSPFGREVVREMNRLGMMVDVSHISKAAMLEAARLSQAPVIASHSAVKALCDHPRNMDDEQLEALAASGGVIQVVALGAFIKPFPPEKERALGELRRRFNLRSPGVLRELEEGPGREYQEARAELDRRWPPPTVEDFVDHIDYAVRKMGIDHVGISSDFDGGGGVEGWQDASQTFNVTLELVRRGYGEEEIARLWGGNLLRVWREVQERAQALRAR